MLCAAVMTMSQPSVVPGSVSIIANNGATSVFETSKISYAVTTTGVPLSDSQNGLGKTLIEIEIRGGNPNRGGNRGIIGAAMRLVSLSDFSGTGEWAIPANDGYAGFEYFLRANLCFERACGGSSNFMTAGASQHFNIIAGSPSYNGDGNGNGNGTSNDIVKKPMASENAAIASGSNTDVSATKPVALKSAAMTNGKAWAVVVGAAALVAALL